MISGKTGAGVRERVAAERTISNGGFNYYFSTRKVDSPAFFRSLRLDVDLRFLEASERTLPRSAGSSSALDNRTGAWVV